MPLVYTAGTSALAQLEVLVRLQREAAYQIATAEIDESLVEVLDASRLPADWKKEPAPLSTKAIGDQWLSQKQSAVLKVPSVLALTEFNYLLNPNHPDFAKIVIGPTMPMEFDQRLLSRYANDVATS